MIKIVTTGLMAAILITQLPEDKKDFKLITALCAGIYIVAYGIERLTLIIEDIDLLLDQIGLDNSYLYLILKCFGITYLGEFGKSLCADAGNTAIGGQIDMAAKLTILALGMPVIVNLIDTITLLM